MIKRICDRCKKEEELENIMMMRLIQNTLNEQYCNTCLRDYSIEVQKLKEQFQKETEQKHKDFMKKFNEEII